MARVVSVSRVLIAIILCLAVPIVPFVIIGELPGERWLSSQDDHALLFGLTGSGLLLSDVLLPIPSSIVGSLLGARLGMLGGFVTTFAGLTGGHVIGYWIGRLALKRLDADMPTAPTLLAVFLSRPVPVLAEAVTFAAGATAAPFLPFLSLVVAGNVLYAAVLAGNGAALLPDGFVGVGLVLPMALPVVGWLVWRWHARRAARAFSSPDPEA